MACFLGHKYENGFCKKCGMREKGFYLPGELKPNNIAAIDIYRSFREKENKLDSLPKAEPIVPASVKAQSAEEFIDKYTLFGVVKDGLFYHINQLMLEMYITAGDEIYITEKDITFYDGKSRYTAPYTFDAGNGTLVVTFPDQTTRTFVLNEKGGISYTADGIIHLYNEIRFA